MKRYILYCLLLTWRIVCLQELSAQPKASDVIEEAFLHPPASAKPWVFWYWMHGAVSKAGITADLEAMKDVGIGGAYLMPIKDTAGTIPFQPVVRQATPEWWEMVRFSMQEAKRLNLQLAMHVSDGFALAGGPWIKPDRSMQKLVWTKNYIRAGYAGMIQLEQPAGKEGFYKEVAVFAYPAKSENAFSDIVAIPAVTASTGTRPQFLCYPDPENQQSFKSDTACWIQYKYPRSFTCRSVRIHVGGNNYQAQRLIIQASDDGKTFRTITRLEPPRHGWQDTDEDYTHSIPATTSSYFRFVYTKEGTEPGSEDLDAAKWKPSFKVMGIYLSDEPVINQYEGKNGSIWRVATNTNAQQVPDSDAVQTKDIINLTGKMSPEGNLDWTPPDNQKGWVIVRIGHTSTGHTNETGGAARGLECDKFNPEAIKLQFNSWFDQAFKKTDPVLAKDVLKIFHVDSWECGSQNWSSNFKTEFQKRRGYDITPYLLVMTGVPVTNAATSEKILHDVRQTIAELVNDIFYATLKKLSHERGCQFSAESVAPTMVSDGLLHYQQSDLPMGEFWLNSPTHDKPNDMLDAISGAHIYGKNIIQAESFTSVRMNWAEHPGNLKATGDRNFALGINKLVLHVFTHNPWLDKKPGMTLDGVGLYFQRDQTWFKQSKSWIDYITRCQAVLQLGKPVVDIAVFTGEEVPRRAILPDRLVNTLPGIFDREKVEAEKRRLENAGQPQRQIPDGVSHSANMADPEDWIDPLNGYAYDSFNPDVLLKMTVKNGRVETPGGASYKILVFPGQHPMNPNHTLMSLVVAKKILQLVKAGATVIMGNEYLQGAGLQDKDSELRQVLKELMKQDDKKGKLLLTPFTDASFDKWGLRRDIEIAENNHSIAWTHRKNGTSDIYFIANQQAKEQTVKLSFRVNDRKPEIWDPVTGEKVSLSNWTITYGRISFMLHLEASQSYLVVFREKILEFQPTRKSEPASIEKYFTKTWSVNFNGINNGSQTALKWEELKSWTESPDPSIHYFSGTAVYTNDIILDPGKPGSRVFLRIDSVYNMATVHINGINCGTIWTAPYQLDITKAVQPGVNKIELDVTNTWHNRLIGDNLLPVEKRVTWTTAPFRLKDKPLTPAGLVGKVKLIIQ